MLRPWLTPAIRKALEMALEEDFSSNIMASNFLFGIIEQYAKYQLGHRIGQENSDDKQFDKLSLAPAINRIKKTRQRLADDLNYVDKINIGRVQARFQDILSERPDYIKEMRFIPAIADRIQSARNAMLHGSDHNFHHMAPYLSVLYILFHYHQVLNNGEIAVCAV